MNTYKTEMHLHTAETSNCGKMPAAKTVAAYEKLGYRTIVVTDHLSRHTYFKYDYEELTWDEKIDIFLRGYRAAFKAANGRLNVLLGMELRFDIENCENDYLVYGVTENFLRTHPDLLNMNLKSFSALAHKNGLMIFQAHPFRFGMTVSRPEHLDGIEIFNGNPRHNSNNPTAEFWAKQHDLKGISGSDHHEIGDEGIGGIQTKTEIRKNDDLLRTLRGNEFIPIIRKK